MSLFELGFLSLLVVLIVLASKGIGHALGISALLPIVPIVGVMALVLHVWTKTPPRALLIYSVVVTAIALLSIFIPLWAVPIAAVLVLVIVGWLLPRPKT